MKTVARSYSRWVAECLPKAFHPSQQDPTEPEGLYWQGADDALPRRQHDNWVYLHARRRSFPTFPELAPAIRSLWQEDVLSVRELVRRLSAQWSDQEIEAAAWKIAGDAAAAGHLLADVSAVTLDLDTALALLAPDLEPIIPAPLPTAPAPGMSLATGRDPADAPALIDTEPYPGPTIDAAQIASPDNRAAFLRVSLGSADLTCYCRKAVG